MMAACARAQEGWTGATGGIARALMTMTLRHDVLFWDGSDFCILPTIRIYTRTRISEH